MKIILLFLLLFSNQLIAQPCDCGIITIKTKWPKPAEENEVYGIVKIKYRLNDSCLAIEPVLFQKLGFGLDEEALRIFNLMSASWNQCKKKCGPCNCKDEEKIYSVYFMNPEFQGFINNIIYGIKCFMIRFRIL